MNRLFNDSCAFYISFKRRKPIIFKLQVLLWAVSSKFSYNIFIRYLLASVIAYYFYITSYIMLVFLLFDIWHIIIIYFIGHLSFIRIIGFHIVSLVVIVITFLAHTREWLGYAFFFYIFYWSIMTIRIHTKYWVVFN